MRRGVLFLWVLQTGLFWVDDPTAFAEMGVWVFLPDVFLSGMLSRDELPPRLLLETFDRCSQRLEECWYSQNVHEISERWDSSGLSVH
ncbi:hypothetical protein Tco_1276935 [Tanacetum coccineum]